MKRPICIKCCRMYRPKENGVYVKELFQKNRAIYRIWCADLLACPVCGHEIVSQFAEKPLAEHFQDEKMAAIFDTIERNNLSWFDWKEYVHKEKAE